MKTQFSQYLNKGIERKVYDAINALGKSLPATVRSIDGQIVTVQFEITSEYNLPMVTIPVVTSEYIRLPIQTGCKGFVSPVDADMALMTGIGDQVVADLLEMPNLSALVFFPVANSNWSLENANQLTLYGPNGVKLSNGERSCIINLTDTGVQITLPEGQEMSVTGGNVTIAEDVVIQNIGMFHHVHLKGGGSHTLGPENP